MLTGMDESDDEYSCAVEQWLIVAVNMRRGNRERTHPFRSESGHRLGGFDGCSHVTD